MTAAAILIGALCFIPIGACLWAGCRMPPRDRLEQEAKAEFEAMGRMWERGE